ncbi:copper amine oxidase N-terminal domain-containing protein [Paenibacillus periandrae]|uniref:copper amine oxidase N-terminal domain-containing protein n=1 Tax=Paenibacillus periandrae TaxID=1761741 RepID=UPI001F091577|nr:copper amine oxidase N-terminal domain-containing protein [Paenibacillus periandrae]
MKTWKKTMVISLAACTLAIPSFASAEAMMMKKYDYSTVTTMMKDGAELAPLRQIAESLGFKVTWNGEPRSITLTKVMMEGKGMMNNMMARGDTFVLQIDSKTIKVGGMDEMLMSAPSIIDDMTYVPKAFIDTYLVK